MRTVVIQAEQTLLDIAIQEYGDMAGLFLLAAQNDISPTGVLDAGQILEVPDVVINKEMQEYCQQNNVTPATAIDPSGELRMKIFTEQFTKQFQ